MTISTPHEQFLAIVRLPPVSPLKASFIAKSVIQRRFEAQGREREWLSSFLGRANRVGFHGSSSKLVVRLLSSTLNAEEIPNPKQCLAQTLRIP
jgi:hypothetical protein